MFLCAKIGTRYIFKDMAVLEVTTRQFRDRQKAFFDLADAGKQIIIRRNGRKPSYALTPIDEDDLYFTPEMEAKIEKALSQAEQGEGVVCKTYEESLKFVESL